MRAKSESLSLIGFVILLVIGIPVDAGIRASFSLDRCSWNATHIVLVQTIPKDGVFSVVESWKGTLKPGDLLEVPGLKPNKDAVPISSYPKPPGFESEDKEGISEQIPRQPVGSRMILFLKKKEQSGAASPSEGNTLKVKVFVLTPGKVCRFKGSTRRAIKSIPEFGTTNSFNCPWSSRKTRAVPRSLRRKSQAY